MMIQPQALIKGRYRVGRRLGEGGMAIVYAGHDLHLGRDVAIKTLRPQFAANPTFRARFEREARAAASLAHPNIIDVHDVGEDAGTPFLVMELVRGQSLKEIIAAEAPFHSGDVAELLDQIGGALDYAHARGYVHRDVKPGNILIDVHGRARVVDFGIAKGLADTDLTETGAGFGTVGYLSPEQAEGLMATPASDVYSSGVVAFEMLTGQLPFRAESPVGVALQHINDPPPAPSAVHPGISGLVDSIVLRALEKDPTRRWPSVSAFAAAMRAGRDASAPATHQPPAAALAPAPRGSSFLTFVVVVMVAVALAALLYAGLRGLPEFSTVPGPADRETQPTVESANAQPTEPIVQAAAEPAEPTPTTTTAPVAAPPPTSPPAPTIAPAVESATEPVVVVPNLQGLTIAGSTGALLPLGLRIALDETVYSRSIPMNAVVSQDPPPGSAVPAGTTVRVSLSRGASPFGDDQQP